jgi:hypothetical protein
MGGGGTRVLRTARPLPEPPDWTRTRDEIYGEQREIFLALRIKPSRRPNEKYDVAVYLVRHDGEPSDVVEQLRLPNAGASAAPRVPRSGPVLGRVRGPRHRATLM